MSSVIECESDIHAIGGVSIPTNPWRSAMTIPREVHLRVRDGGIELVQKPVTELAAIRQDERQCGPRELRGEMRLEDVAGGQLEIEAVFDPADAESCGLVVHRNGRQGTYIGYDRQRSVLFVDRRRSGDVDFHPAFAGQTEAPLRLDDEGLVHLHILVDRSSVEVFADGGAVAMTNRVFPSPGESSVAVFAVGGTARLQSLTAFRLQSIWSGEESVR